MSDKQVVFIDSVHPVLEQKLRQVGMNCLDHTKTSFENLLPFLAKAYGVVIRSRFTIDTHFLSLCPNLKFIARSGSGLENIDTKICRELGIRVYNSPEGNRNAVAEHALGMLLSLFHKIQKADKEIRNGEWSRESNRGEELDGKTVGIIGYGNNGSAFAKKLRGFDVRVLAHDKYKSGFGDHFVQECTLNAILEQADVLSFHIPQNKETRFIFNDDFVSKMHKPFYVLNLSRGKIVETEALVSGLKSGKIKGAGLDVLEFESQSFESFFEQELPSSFSYLISAENVVLTPHVGGWTTESYIKLSSVLAEKILADEIN